MPINKPSTKKIIQVVPAVGWEVVYTDDDGQETMAEDVAFFGLVEEIGPDGTAIAGDTINYLVPMLVDGTAIVEEDSSNFTQLRRKA